MRGLFAIVGALVLLAARPVMAADVSGDWLGTITIGAGQSFHEAIHIKRAPGGGYVGTLDSLDRGLYGVPLADIVAMPDALSFTVPVKPAAATYTARWDAASGTWIGQWTQSGQAVPLTLTAGVAAPRPVVSGLDGVWNGVLAGGRVPLHLVLHVRTGAGGTVAWLDSTDQLAYGLGVDTISRDGAKVRFALAAPPAGFSGVMAADRQSLTGQWSQGGREQPLTLARQAPGEQAAALARPQTPVKPYPYAEEQVSFEDSAAHVRLAGTLTVPPGDGPFPAVLLVAGSGPNTRDEPGLGHRIFLVLADHLTRNGVAVLRYDKRGTGESSGDYASATTQDFADDAEAGMAYLRGLKAIDPRRVGLIGHSEGGLIAPMVAVRDPATAFVVMMAGPGVKGVDILKAQGRLIAAAMGVDDAGIVQSAALNNQMFAIVDSEKDPAVAAAKLRALLSANARSRHLSDAMVDAQIRRINTDWFRFFFDYDPATTLRRVRCPVLAIDGSKDLQVPPDQNLPPIRAALAGNPDAEVDELPGLNHLFQTAKTGSPGEYGQIEETLSPLAMDTMTRWILRQVGRR